MSSKPLISVLMNCFNGEEYLRESLESVLSQTYANWELVFWDNKSTDNSRDIFFEYEDSRFNYFSSPTHTTLYEARNRAISHSCGEFVGFLDVDDWWEPDKLERQLCYFQEPTVGVVYGNYWRYDQARRERVLGSTRALPSGWVLSDCLTVGAIGILTAVVRRAALDQLMGPCDPRYQIIGDFDLFVRLARNWEFRPAEAPVATYRWHGRNETTRKWKRHLDELDHWVLENRHNRTLSCLTAFHRLEQSIEGRKALAFARDHEWRKVTSSLRKMRFGIRKIRVTLDVLVFLLRAICRRRYSSNA